MKKILIAVVLLLVVVLAIASCGKSSKTSQTTADSTTPAKIEGGVTTAPIQTNPNTPSDSGGEKPAVTTAPWGPIVELTSGNSSQPENPDTPETTKPWGPLQPMKPIS